MSACGICTSERLDELESLGLEALEGKRSWRSTAQALGLGHHQSLKNHMENHYVAAPSLTDVAVDGFEALIAKAIEDLIQRMAVAPAELAPMYAVAIQNMRHITLTKPSQQNLVLALKAIHEVTGMKLEQRLMFEFAKHAFPSPTQAAVGEPVIGALPPVREAIEVE